MAHLLKLISKFSNPQNAKPRIRLGKREGLSFGLHQMTNGDLMVI